MKKKGKKIKVVKLTEKERHKFTKKHKCKRCDNFFVDTREELDYHMRSLHGEYSFKEHQEDKTGNKHLRKLYLTRNASKAKSSEEIREVKLKPVNCFVCWCKNCEKIVAIHMDMKMELQDDVVCPNCRMNVFVNNTRAVVGHMVSKGMTPAAYRYEYGIDTLLFKGYTESELKLKAKGRTLGEFVERRNGKK